MKQILKTLWRRQHKQKGSNMTAVKLQDFEGRISDLEKSLIELCKDYYGGGNFSCQPKAPEKQD